MNYAAWQKFRIAIRLTEADNSTDFWNHLITIVVFATEADPATALPATLASLREQHYRNIEVLVAGIPCDPTSDLADFSGHRGLFFEPELGPLDFLTSPGTDRLWRGSHLVFARAGTEFAPDAFTLLNAALNPAPGKALPDLVLCDHDRLSVSGELTAPSFGPGWDPDLICAFDYVETAFLASRELVLAQRTEPRPESLHHWLCTIARGLQQPVTGHIAEPLVHMPASTPQPALQAVAPATAWAASAPLPSMAIIIPNRNNSEMLKRCVGFLEFANNFQPELVIVDNASDEAALNAVYDDLRSRYGARIVQMNRSFNFSCMVNLGVAVSTAEVVLLLNNDVEITKPGLLEQILVNALRPEVGVVGSRLLYPDGTVQHAGVMLWRDVFGACAGHVLRGAPRTLDGYLFQSRTIRNYQCVTGALQAVRREVFQGVGGYDEVSLPVDYGDIDFCLRVRRAGLRVIALPLDNVFHLESATRGTYVTPEAAAAMAKRWPEATAHDPYRNPWVDVCNAPEAPFPWSPEPAA